MGVLASANQNEFGGIVAVQQTVRLAVPQMATARRGARTQRAIQRREGRSGWRARTPRWGIEMFSLGPSPAVGGLLRDGVDEVADIGTDLPVTAEHRH
jgi:hypothetical protein